MRDHQKWLPPRRAARLLGVASETLRGWARSDKLPPGAVAVLPAGQRRYRVGMIESAFTTSQNSHAEDSQRAGDGPT